MTYEEIQQRYQKALETHNVQELLECSQLFRKLDTREAALLTLFAAGSAYEIQGNYKDALSTMNEALDLAQSTGDQKALMRVQGSLANIYRATGDYPQAFERYYAAIDAADALGDRGRWAANMANLGNLLLYTGDYVSALERYHKALEVHVELDRKMNIAVVTGNIGNIHSAQGEHELATEHYQRAFEQHKAIDDVSGMARALGNLGKVTAQRGDQLGAREYYEQSLRLRQDLEEASTSYETLIDIIYTYLRTDDFDKARELVQSIDGETIADPRVSIARDRARAELLLNEGKAKESREMLLTLLDFAREKQQLQGESAIHEDLMYVAIEANDLSAYIEHSREHDRIQKELSGTETHRKLMMQEKQHEIDLRDRAVQQERDRERALLYGALPRSVADRMLSGEQVKGDSFANVSVLFMDIVGFTQHSSTLEATEVITHLEEIFGACDEICHQMGLTKIKTIGDCYMAVGGIPEPLDESEVVTAQAALMMLQKMKEIDVEVRIGLNCGPVVAGVLGTERLQYDVWGDTVNVASRMESSGEPGKVQCSEAFVATLPGNTGLDAGEGISARKRGIIEIKGKGSMTTYWLEGA